MITVLWSRAFKTGKQTGKYEFKCDGKKWDTGGQTISCTYTYYDASPVVEGETLPPHPYFRNEVKGNELIISTFDDPERTKLVSMEVYDPTN